MGGSSVSENYQYDAAGNLHTKESRMFTYNSVNQITNAGFSYDNNGNLTCDGTYIYIYNANYYYDASGNLVGMKKNNQTYIYHNNLRGDIVSITDYNGNIQAQYHYDPWGTQISNSGTLTQPFRYAGYYYDDETGLYYLKNRYYSPALGRFLTKDRYGYVDYKDGQTLNLYSYCGNNPVSNVDPDGNFFFIPVLIATAPSWVPYV